MKNLSTRIGWAGVDEAGRGPLAGPVVAAAVILPDGFDLNGIQDSKKLTSFEREDACVKIKQDAVYSIAISDVYEIDNINILRATFLAMERCIVSLEVKPHGVMVDGNRYMGEFCEKVECIVKGDSKYAEIAAASILAKTFRDDLMMQMAIRYPQYGFENHFGYATPEHLLAIEKYGPCDIHRRSFDPLRTMLEQPCLDIGR